MVESPKVLDTVVGFHEDWLDLYLLENIQRDTTLYPLFYEGMISSMKTETRLFLSNVFWYGDANWDDLFFEQVHINQELATLYGMEQSPTDWDRVEVSEERAGLFQNPLFDCTFVLCGIFSCKKRSLYPFRNAMYSISYSC